jgi:asparagine synthase (glutamine-hydrolysing)
MCGINGIYHNGKGTDDIDSKIQKMNDFIIHRGPDDEGIFIEKNKDYALAIGMRRLSIIDLSSGKQPIFSRDKSQVIVFNGEIYNYRKLKKALVEEGVTFDTTSDTEVIIRLYEKYGVKSFSMLDGMFGFSIYDKNLDKVFVVRDFFGEKPMYYYKTNNKLYWASELKSIIGNLDKIPEISNEALSLYFQLTYIPAPFTIYQGIKKLEADSYLEFDCVSQDLKVVSIAHDQPISYDKKMSFSQAKTITHDLVSETVQSRAVSDVPIGTFLSGGVDSSIVSLCLSKNSSKPIDTFSIGFEKKSFDESDKAQLVSKLIGSNHHEFVISDKDLINDVDSILLNYDEPFADPAVLPTFLVSKLTQQHVKVALTGDGGDEVFGGYNKYYIGKMNRIYTQTVPRSLHNNVLTVTEKLLIDKSDNRGLKFKLNRLLKSINYDNEFYYNIISLGFQNNEIDRLINDENRVKNALDYFKSGTPGTLRDFKEVDKNISLEGALLVKVDRASMLNSIECRAPFLNKKLWDFTNQLPDDYLLKGWDKKYLLKESFKQYFPNKFLDKSKKGFQVPVGDWLRSSFKKELLSYIEVPFLEKQNLFETDYIRELVMNHVLGKVDNSYRVWTYYCFQKWYVNKYID